MDTQKIIDIARQLQEALPFDCGGITSKEQYEEAIALTDKLIDSHDDNNSILYEVLWPAISRYEDSALEFTDLNKSLIKLDDDESERYAKVLISAVQFFENEKEALIWLKTPIKALGGRLPIDMLSNDKDTEIVLNVIGRLEHGIFT
ncbi:antitoxin Xre/MbcA/ParS toxin-binding domain-containing protein [Psychromonas sp. GE-S-Ul-11]|uniref:antitoxin Xre/MbcA/ParS toxin-binding domain-containing protein n=1 Tax=unclassified Psychromonas TaxID=2614957 RepID=UPI00390CBE6F